MASDFNCRDSELCAINFHRVGMRTQPLALMSGKLIRALGPWDLTAIGINGVIGSGIFILPAAVASLAGTWSPLIYIFSGLATFLIALCFAEAASYFTVAGGPYLYVHQAFGGFAG